MLESFDLWRGMAVGSQALGSWQNDEDIRKGFFKF